MIPEERMLALERRIDIDMIVLHRALRARDAEIERLEQRVKDIEKMLVPTASRDDPLGQRVPLLQTVENTARYLLKRIDLLGVQREKDQTALNTRLKSITDRLPVPPRVFCKTTPIVWETSVWSERRSGKDRRVAQSMHTDKMRRQKQRRQAKPVTENSNFQKWY